MITFLLPTMLSRPYKQRRLFTLPPIFSESQSLTFLVGTQKASYRRESESAVLNIEQQYNNAHLKTSVRVNILSKNHLPSLIHCYTVEVHSGSGFLFRA